MSIDEKIALEVASHEAVVRQAYKDSVGVWTWSIGITSATGHDVTRYIDKPATLSRCLDIYIWALKKYVDDVIKAFHPMKLSAHQLAGAVSFHYNTGAIFRATWVKQVKSGDFGAARLSIMQWNKPAEIVGRRRKERDLFFDGKWSNDGTMTEYTRLKANKTPDWSSAKKINVTKEIRDLLGGVPDIPASDIPQERKEAVKNDEFLESEANKAKIKVAGAILAVSGISAWAWFKSLPCSILGIMCGG